MICQRMLRIPQPAANGSQALQKLSDVRILTSSPPAPPSPPPRGVGLKDLCAHAGPLVHEPRIVEQQDS